MMLMRKNHKYMLKYMLMLNKNFFLNINRKIRENAFNHNT